MSTRASRVGVSAGHTFTSAIRTPPDIAGCVSIRDPRWYVVRFGLANDELLLRLLDLNGLPYHLFTYRYQGSEVRITDGTFRGISGRSPLGEVRLKCCG